jgi:hypothetical protein
MKSRISLCSAVALLAALLTVTVACQKAPNDAQIQQAIQAKFSQDSGLQGKQLGVQSAAGVVTLSGPVDNEAQRAAAASQAASVPGVKEVVNNLEVAPATPPEPTAQEPPNQEEPKPVAKPRPAKRAAAPVTVASQKPADTPAPVPTPSPTPVAAAPVPPPPPPPPQKVTIPSGTTLAVRLVDAIDSEKNQSGQTFHATLDTPLSVEGDVAIPSGYDVTGHLVSVKSAGKFAGQSEVILQLDSLSVGDKYYNIQTDQYKRTGSSRGKNTAEKVGVGAGIGAIIGGLAGGGKGAAIGAAAGGGLGGGVQAATKGQQIKLPTETVINFTLQAPLTVVPAQGPNSGRTKLNSN